MCVADLVTRQSHESSEYKALENQTNARLAKAARDLAAARDRERAARTTIQQVTEQLLVAERRCVLLEDELRATEEARAKVKVSGLDCTGLCLCWAVCCACAVLCCGL